MVYEEVVFIVVVWFWFVPVSFFEDAEIYSVILAKNDLRYIIYLMQVAKKTIHFLDTFVSQGSNM